MYYYTEISKVKNWVFNDTSNEVIWHHSTQATQECNSDSWRTFCFKPGTENNMCVTINQSDLENKKLKLKKISFFGVWSER